MLPPDLRPKAFAAVELFLDLNHIARSMFEGDLETVLIWFSITEATLHPFMLDETIPAEKRLEEKPASRDLGSISRAMIAERTGLPRETVRRKINTLIQAGFVAEEKSAHVRTVFDITAPHVTEAIAASYKAVQRYLRRLGQLGVQP